MNIFISSTYNDLVDHRKAVNDTLLRMKLTLSAMEFFGSRTDEAVPVCTKEILACDFLVGIYAWRYGWQPTPAELSITEQEFDFARSKGKRCLCYLVEESHPWPPKYVDRGPCADSLVVFKKKVSHLVRSVFTTPDNLAKQVAADLARELLPERPPDSFGGLVRVNWEVFSPEVQNILTAAYEQAQVESDDGVVATRHVFAALADVPNSGRFLVNAYPRVNVPRLMPNLKAASVAEMFDYGAAVSGCVLGSMKRLLPRHSPTQRLLALELAVDLLKHGTGTSVADYRNAGVDEKAVDATLQMVKAIASRKQRVSKALMALRDEDVLYLAYLANISVPTNLFGGELCDAVLMEASNQGRSVSLVGEMLRRFPNFIGESRSKSNANNAMPATRYPRA